MKAYIAQSGESLLSIAHKTKCSVSDLLHLNPAISNPDQLYKDQVIYLPTVDETVETSSTQKDYVEHWIPITPIEKMAQNEYDVVIVGSGASGGAVLWRLCEQWQGKNKRIAMIEAGDILLPSNFKNIPTFDTVEYWKYLKNPKISDFIGRSLPEFPGAIELYGLGGKTLFWGTICPRMQPFELKDWPIPLQEMEHYYDIAEDVLNVTNAYTQGSTLTEILLKRLRENGFNAQHYPRALDLQPTRYGQVHTPVAFSSIEFLARSLTKQPVDLAIRSRVSKVLVENEKINGVEVISSDKQTYTVHGKTIVLAASPFESARILLNSDLPHQCVGHYLTDHIITQANGILDISQFPNILGSIGLMVPSSQERPYQMNIGGPGGYEWTHFKKMPQAEKLDIGYYAGSGSIETRYENRVYVDPEKKDQYGLSKLQVDFKLSAKDYNIIQMLSVGMEKAAHAMKIQLTQKENQPLVRMLPLGSFHMSSTCRMGKDPNTSVINPQGEMHHVKDLYVVGNSMLPSLGAANPTLTTIALSIRSADIISKNYQ